MFSFFRAIWDFIAGLFDRGVHDLPAYTVSATPPAEPKVRTSGSGFRSAAGSRIRWRRQRPNLPRKVSTCLYPGCQEGGRMLVAMGQTAYYHRACRTKARAEGFRPQRA